ncbi:DUF979 domain-containing protein [Novosphingobium sp. ZN18A2]|uniref:DUF979 domain-containing protein n=1 Tax=Novosphingobium sp. ZN18A2 TaxID=3079861 RepID=UPI0030CD29D2
MITLQWVYVLAGIAFAGFALLGLFDRRLGMGASAFWALLAISMLAGDRLGDFGNGLLVLALVAIAALGGLKHRTLPVEDAEHRAQGAARYGNALFAIALVIPITALAGTLGFKYVPGLVEVKQVTLISLALGVVLALLIGHFVLRAPAMMPLNEGRRLMDQVGWAAILPQMLASLGAIFALAGVGDVVGRLIGEAAPGAGLFALVAIYAVGMAAFTMVMGNAFAAFPVMMAAVGLPLLIHGHHGNPAPIAAIGMLAGFCGTLMTPMAANFNLVPAALLELKDRNGVIRAQVPTAIPLLGVNVFLIWWLAFPA